MYIDIYIYNYICICVYVYISMSYGLNSLKGGYIGDCIGGLLTIAHMGVRGPMGRMRLDFF